MIAFHTAQGGWNVATEALKFDLNRLNPATGFKRLGPSTGGMELLRMSVAATLIGILGWSALMRTSRAAANWRASRRSMPRPRYGAWRRT